MFKSRYYSIHIILKVLNCVWHEDCLYLLIVSIPSQAVWALRPWSHWECNPILRYHRIPFRSNIHLMLISCDVSTVCNRFTMFTGTVTLTSRDKWNFWGSIVKQVSSTSFLLRKVWIEPMGRKQTGGPICVSKEMGDDVIKYMKRERAWRSRKLYPEAYVGAGK